MVRRKVEFEMFSHKTGKYEKKVIHSYTEPVNEDYDSLTHLSEEMNNTSCPIKLRKLGEKIGEIMSKKYRERFKDWINFKVDDENI